VHVPLIIRDLEPEDLAALEWTGGPEHLRAVAADLGAAAAGGVAQLLIEVPNGCLVGFGAVDFRRSSDTGTLWRLSVRDTWQSLGVGTRLIRALEERILAGGRDVATITVEHDNPRAAALYRRMGYVATGSELDSWSIGRNRTYVTVCTVLRRRLR
jgi:ribosomal protein S18 acetylase RimI-like enzyme